MTATRVLIVGGGGPIGRRITAVVSADGGEAMVVGRTTTPPLDVRDHDGVRSVFAGARPDAVHYLVNGGPEEERALADRVGDFSHVVETAAAHGVRTVVLASSAAVYGTEHLEPRAESDALDGATPYAREKIALESALAALHDTEGVTGVALRIFNVFGPGLRNSLINRLGLPGARPTLRVSDRFVRDYVHVDDVARAFALATVSAPAGFTPVNIGTGRATSNSELARLAGPDGYVADDASFPPSFSVADVALARALWEFSPGPTAADALGDPGRWLDGV